MKKHWTLTALIALTAGAAHAATEAGTVITNTAEIVFTPKAARPHPVESNKVTTTVLPVPSFTIVKNDGSADVTTPDYSKPGQTATARPGDTVVFPYTLTNTGNVPNESYVLTNTPTRPPL